MKQRIFIIFLLTQMIIIAILVVKIEKKQVLGLSINKIYSKNIQKAPSEELKKFYEPDANSTIEEPRDWLSYIPKYTINSDSLNERYDYNLKKNKDVFRIITLGDSFTYGQNVSTKNNWTELLEDSLNNGKVCPQVNRYEVINLGMAGYDTAYEVERYKKRGQKYNPDLIIWYVTDLNRITDEFLTLAEKMNINERDNEKKGIFNKSWSDARRQIIQKYGEDNLINYQITKFKELRNNYYKTGPILFISHLKELENNIKNIGNENIYFSNTRVIFENSNLLPDGHFNDKGHARFAQEVEGDLIRKKLIPCL